MNHTKVENCILKTVYLIVPLVTRLDFSLSVTPAFLWRGNIICCIVSSFKKQYDPNCTVIQCSYKLHWGREKFILWKMLNPKYLKVIVIDILSHFVLNLYFPMGLAVVMPVADILSEETSFCLAFPIVSNFFCIDTPKTIFDLRYYISFSIFIVIAYQDHC